MSRFTFDAERVKELYYEKKLPIPVIARRFGTSTKTIKRILKNDEPIADVRKADWWWK